MKEPFYEYEIQGVNFIIPDYMASSIQLYLSHGIEPGSFLSAVICNDLSSAVGYADRTNLMNLPAYIGFFYNEAPSQSWGSKEKMVSWTKEKQEVIHDTST